MAESARPGSGPGSGPDTGATVWQPATTAAYVETPERVVVLDLDHLDRAPYVFEGSAAQVWACIDGDRTQDEIVRDLSEVFQAPVDVVAADVHEFVDHLRELGLVVAGGTADG